MKLTELNEKKNAFNLKEWKRCHSDWRVIDVMTWHVCGWQWITITARKGHGSTFDVFHFNNKEAKSWWTSNERYFWRKWEEKTLQDIANYYNESEDLNTSELESMIEDAGFISDCDTEWGICHNDTEKVIIDDSGKAIVTTL